MPTDENYIVVQGFMVNKLGLKGNELLTYAIIYGFSQDGESEFTGSISYLRFWLGITKANAIHTLKNLVDKGFVIKQERVINNIRLPVYRANLDLLKNNTPGIETIPPGIETIPNNIEDNIGTIKKEYKERNFVKPTVEEVKAYCEERKNKIDPQYFVDFYESKGWKIGKEPMKDWKACVRTWERKDKPKKETERNEPDYSEFYL